MKPMLYIMNPMLNCGGVLDVVNTRVDDTPSVVDVICIPSGASDHRLVTWPFLAAPAKTPVYKFQHFRSWHQFNIERFRPASCLCDGILGPPSLDGASTAAHRSTRLSQLYLTPTRRWPRSLVACSPHLTGGTPPSLVPRNVMSDSEEDATGGPK